MGYDLKIKDKKTEQDFETEIEDLKALKQILESFDETKIDFELHKKEKVIKIKL